MPIEDIVTKGDLERFIEQRANVAQQTQNAVQQALVGRVAFPGMLAPSATSVAPTGWLLCDGASYLRADYPDLFAAIGTTYGAVDGAHFSVIDMRGRIAVGLGTHADVDALTDNDGAAVGSRTPKMAVTSGQQDEVSDTDPNVVKPYPNNAAAGAAKAFVEHQYYELHKHKVGWTPPYQTVAFMIKT